MKARSLSTDYRTEQRVMTDFCIGVKVALISRGQSRLSFIEVHMLEIFYTEDGEYHQAVLSNGEKAIVNICIDRLITRPNQVGGWEWMVWVADRPWREPATTWYGSGSSLTAAKLAALDAAVVLADHVSRNTRSNPKARQRSLVH